MKFLFLGLAVGLQAQLADLMLSSSYSYNETCVDTTQEQKCVGECNDGFNVCLSLCSADDAKCRQLCNRDLTTCVDRCPCHDKCSWGCPCGFYQCAPPTTCNLEPANKDPFEKCGIACIQEADFVTGACFSQQGATEDICYKEGNDAGIKCMANCPCGTNCPGGCSTCDTPIGIEVCEDGGISNQEQCKYIWGPQEANCGDEVTFNLNICVGGCVSSDNISICQDQCNSISITAIKQCPCHTDCPNGCPCTSDNNFGNKFCPTLPQADPICLDGVNGGISQECRDGCTNYAYTCVSTCYGNSDCISACQQQESLCVNNCPCYGQCPNGCPCYGWCENTPPPITYQCSQVWGDEASSCEADRRAVRDSCNAKCPTDPYPQQCEDICATQYATDLSNCPCHTNCANGCSCPAIDVLGNSYCPSDGLIPDGDCLLDYGQASQACRDKCTTAAFTCTNKCNGNAACMAECRNSENDCIYLCPCYEGCQYPENPNCDPPKIEQCKAIWGAEALACENDRKTDLTACMSSCNGNSLCGDNCNQKYTDDTKDCPCHTNCSNGCACPEIDVLGNSYCPRPPTADKDCLEQYGDISAECRDVCTNTAYYCSVACKGDQTCINDCRFDENNCVSKCPCYPECPLGCPCSGWCGGVSPEDKCEAIWGDEAKACDDDCRTQRTECIKGCNSNSTCEDQCNTDYLEKCSYYCPCHTFCQNGCSCPPNNELGNSYCPEYPPKPDGDCLLDNSNSDISKQCRNQCTNNAYNCVVFCFGDQGCESVCKADEIDCINKCPCYPECPNGCPCPNWCGDPENPSLNDKCDLIWGQEASACIGDCKAIRNQCIAGCNGSSTCEDRCNDDYLNKCSYYCPCHTYCPNGCPCYNELGQSYCPNGPGTDPTPPPNCIQGHGSIEKQCRDACTDQSYDCIKVCLDYDCASDCKVDMQKCTQGCPCHQECPEGCPCPIWCPATTPKPTTETGTTLTTQTPGGGTNSPIDPIFGDHLLILSRDGATIMQWAQSQSDATFTELTKGYQDTAARFDINGFWTHDSCSVQLNGESYLIGGAYDCTAEQSQYCSHLNVQRAVVKLSKTKCGLDIVMDGINKKLPYDMKEHSCTKFMKQINNRPEQERVIMCSPTDSADDPNTEANYKDRACWSSLDMITWEPEPWLKWQHIKGTMTYHKGRVVIMGGTGLNSESFIDHPYVEWFNQNGVYNDTDQTFGTWSAGTSLPLSIEETTSISVDGFLYIFGGLNYRNAGSSDFNCNPFQDSAACNSKKVYRNQDPTNGFSWFDYGDLMKPRSRMHTIIMGEKGQTAQMFHVAGYAKVTVNGQTEVTGRSVERWSLNKKSQEKDIQYSSISKSQSELVLFNYISPQSFVISDVWYNTYCL